MYVRYLIDEVILPPIKGGFKLNETYLSNWLVFEINYWLAATKVTRPASKSVISACSQVHWLEMSLAFGMSFVRISTYSPVSP